ncbi:hypothetical protein [Anaerosinus massiliensis]|uniref:hypothetical protein n=1 Tax=Massilibacillus massiliensis TaxID=1806837 RepID=UPI000DA63B2E|nr:hypothetical protein [Massilibacillus massiliensis]
MDNKGALEWLQRELNHQKYDQDFAKSNRYKYLIDKYQVVIDALTIAVDAVKKQDKIDDFIDNVEIEAKLLDGIYDKSSSAQMAVLHLYSAIAMFEKN